MKNCWKQNRVLGNAINMTAGQTPDEALLSRNVKKLLFHSLFFPASKHNPTQLVRPEFCRD